MTLRLMKNIRCKYNILSKEHVHITQYLKKSKRTKNLEQLFADINNEGRMKCSAFAMTLSLERMHKLNVLVENNATLIFAIT
jgi:hypothetical protein